jgi:hypothetical protein
MSSAPRRSGSAHRLRIWTLLLYLCIFIFLAQPAVGEIIAGSAHDSWRWGGYSRSSWVSIVVGDSSLASATALLEATPLATAAASDTSGMSLSGVVYYDINGDGVRDSSDWGIRDAVVSLSLANSSSPVASVVTAYDGTYTFSNLTAGDYALTLLTPSDRPGQPSVGTLVDSAGYSVASGAGTAAGTVSGQDGITSIQIGDGNTAVQGVNYDFPQLTYPTSLISKRMLINTNPGIHNTTPVTPIPTPPPVPEPGSLAMLVVAGLFLGLGGLRRRRR